MSVTKLFPSQLMQLIGSMTLRPFGRNNGGLRQFGNLDMFPDQSNIREVLASSKREETNNFIRKLARSRVESSYRLGEGGKLR